MIGLASQTARPRISVIGRKRGADVLRPLSPEHPDDETFEGLLIVRPEGRLYFGNAQDVTDRITALVAEHKPRVVTLDLSRVPDIEYSALQMLIDGRARITKYGRHGLARGAQSRRARSRAQRRPRQGTRPRSDALQRARRHRALSVAVRTVVILERRSAFRVLWNVHFLFGMANLPSDGVARFRDNRRLFETMAAPSAPPVLEDTAKALRDTYPTASASPPLGGAANGPPR